MLWPQGQRSLSIGQFGELMDIRYRYHHHTSTIQGHAASSCHVVLVETLTVDELLSQNITTAK